MTSSHKDRQQFFRLFENRTLTCIRLLAAAFLMVFAAGCGVTITSDSDAPPSPNLPVLETVEQSTAADSLSPDQSSSPVSASPGEGIIPDSGWSPIHQGLDRRVINLPVAEGGETQSLYLLRIDPDYYSFDVGYQPGDAKSILKWSEDTGALIVVNGGYFTEEEYATSLIISGGTAQGTSYQGFGGMLAVNEAGPQIRWLQQQPYDSSESLVAGLQSFPMLITPGGNLRYKDEGGDKARRTIVGTDVHGRFLIIISPSATFTLAEMSAYVLDSDLELDAALNLDGGASTGLFLADPGEGIPAFSELPSVLLVYPK